MFRGCKVAKNDTIEVLKARRKKESKCYLEWKLGEENYC